MTQTATTPGGELTEGETRRDFLLISTAAVGAVGTALALWPFIDTMNPAADTLALSTTDVDLSAIEEGQSITVVWRGKPVFIRHRTAEEIEMARSAAMDDLIDQQKDEDRVKQPQWLVLVGVCTHLGCIPLGQKVGPCHGSHYDTSGRIRKGPAPLNLAVPAYEFTDETTIRIG